MLTKRIEKCTTKSLGIQNMHHIQKHSSLFEGTIEKVQPSILQKMLPNIEIKIFLKTSKTEQLFINNADSK